MLILWLLGAVYFYHFVYQELVDTYRKCRSGEEFGLVKVCKDGVWEGEYIPLSRDDSISYAIKQCVKLNVFVAAIILFVLYFLIRIFL